jgi:hypothetical protein
LAFQNFLPSVLKEAIYFASEGETELDGMPKLAMGSN